MKLKFVKLQGCGNDFILIDEDLNPGLTDEIREKLSMDLRDRHFSIGADSVLFVKKDGHEVIFRTMEDGVDLDMCGTGVRCTAHYYHQKEGKERINIITIGRDVLELKTEKNFYSVNMGPLQPVQRYTGRYKGNELIVKADELLTKEEKKFASDLGIDVKKGYFLNPGEAHLVFFVDDAERANLRKIAENFAFNKDLFPESTNVSVCTIVDPSSISIRTYERAAFHETLACGTGSVAAACAARAEYGLEASKVRVISRGGEQFVRFEGENSLLIGPAQTVFNGEIEIDT